MSLYRIKQCLNKLEANWIIEDSCVVMTGEYKNTKIQLKGCLDADFQMAEPEVTRNGEHYILRPVEMIEVKKVYDKQIEFVKEFIFNFENN